MKVGDTLRPDTKGSNMKKAEAKKIAKDILWTQLDSLAIRVRAIAEEELEGSFDVDHDKVETEMLALIDSFLRRCENRELVD